MQNKNESKVRSLKEEAYDRIYFDIITLKLKPGQHLSESFLQKEYGMTQLPFAIPGKTSPIREEFRTPEIYFSCDFF